MNPLTRMTIISLLSLALAACGGDTTDSSAGGQSANAHSEGGAGALDAHDAEEVGPHGGPIVVVGDHVAHLEALHDMALGRITVYVLDEGDRALSLDQPPVLSLVTSAGSTQVRATPGADAWVFENDALRGEPEKARFQIVLGGQTWPVPLPSAHGHGEGTHGPHDGTLTTFADGLGHLELKLHDDKGDLELWLTRDVEGAMPYDLPLDARITVTFSDHADRKVELAVRNTNQNEDEDGKANLRGGKTNYFIFPGDTGADAAWLMGGEFASQVFLTIEADGKSYVTQPFDLRPHTHGAGAHGH